MRDLSVGLVYAIGVLCSGCVLGTNSIGTMPAHAAFPIPCDAGLIGALIAQGAKGRVSSY